MCLWGTRMSSVEQGVEEWRKHRQFFVIGVAKISISEGEPSTDCIVMDWTESGAQLRLVEPDQCPDSFTLFTRDGGTTDCRVIWRRDAYIGVAFVEPSPRTK